MPQFTVLACLDEFGPASQRDIARRLRLDPSDLVPIVDRLETDGLARREKDPADRRRHALALTAKGRRWVTSMQQTVTDRRGVIMPDFDDAEVEQFTHMLRRCLAAVDARFETP
jgi:DNA-binding MarR family transcriptional regulator